MSQILSSLEESQKTKGKPTVIIAHTIKGKGISFAENRVGYHGIAPKTEGQGKNLWIKL